MNTTTKKPLPSDPEKKFRSFVDHTVDIMSRYSVQKLKKKIDLQKEMDFQRAMKLR